VGFLHSASKGSASARAQLTTFHDGLVSQSSQQGGMSQRASFQTTFQMRVTPGDGQPEFESRMSVWGSDCDHLQPGRWTYVRYDPDTPDHCHLDKDRLAQEFEPLYSGRHRVMIPKEVSDAWFKSSTTVDAPTPPEPASKPDGIVAELSQLGDMHAAGTLSDAEFEAAKARLLGEGEDR
jgi:hypothetical protein